ncbi:hypothetical protein B0T18DRAFT_167421 [Schizothecium vesticola]|uniref:Uncharacterized protein n=1 Tax=Schizothecium vesticola TaxID=314040 RepID=A0AA40K1J1_9PEZI|nr:hypothetical protein B0T18DRAFT_167421 [Schizothecium vesticola]
MQHRRHCRRWLPSACWRNMTARDFEQREQQALKNSWVTASPAKLNLFGAGPPPAVRYDAGRNLSALAPLSANGHPSVPKALRWVPTVVRRGALCFRPPGKPCTLASATPKTCCPRRAGALPSQF